MTLVKLKANTLLLCFATAMGFHLLLVGLFYPSFKSSYDNGVTPTHIVTTFFYPVVAKGIAGNALKNTMNSRLNNTLPEKGQQTEKTINSQQNIAASHSKNSNGHLKLLAALHNAIQQKQLYPADAIFMHHSGTTVVQFSLLPSGKIMDSNILKSSGYQRLDTAALNAVTAISPFNALPTRIKQHFNIAVSFAINSINTL